MKNSRFVHHLMVVAAVALGLAFASRPRTFWAVAVTDSSSCSVLVEKGRNLLAQQQFSKAEELLTSAAKQCPQRAEIFDALGLASDFDNHPVQAQAAFRRAIALEPGSSGFHGHLAANLIRSGDETAGMAEFRKALAIEPANETANLNLATLLLAKKQYAAALHFLKAAKAERSQDPAVLLQLTQAYFGTGDEESGRETAERLANLPGLEPAIHFSLGLQLAEHKQYEQAARQFAAIPAADRDAAADIDLGMAYSKLGRLQEARAAYNDALRLDASNPDVYLHIGLDVAKTGDESAALDWILQASQKSAGRADIQCALVQQFIRVGNFEQAQDTVMHALERHDRDPDLREAQGDLLRQEGKPAEAAKTYLQLLQAEPLRVSARVSLAVTYEQLRQNGQARHELEAALRLDPHNAEANAQLGHLELDANHEGAADERIRQALALDPDNLTANEDRAVFLVRAGKLTEAEAVLQRLARLDPNNPQVHYQLGRVLAQLQRPAEAQAEFGLSKQLQASREQHSP